MTAMAGKRPYLEPVPRKRSDKQEEGGNVPPKVKNLGNFAGEICSSIEKEVRKINASLRLVQARFKVETRVLLQDHALFGDDEDRETVITIEGDLESVDDE